MEHLQALSPFPGLSFIRVHGVIGLFVLGSVFLARDGCGKRARPHWPCLLAVPGPAVPRPPGAYATMGQGALILNDPRPF